MIRTRQLAPVVAALAVALGACERASNDASLSQDSALARDLAIAGQDSLAQPQLQDVPTTATPTPPAPEAPRAVEQPTATPRPAPRATTGAPRRDPTPPPPRVVTRPRPATPRPTTTRPETPRPATPPGPVVTASGNTVTSGDAGARAGGGAVGYIPGGTALALSSGSRICTNTHKVGDRFTATVADAVTGENGASIPAGASVVLEVTGLKRSENANDRARMSFSVVSISFGGNTYATDAEIVSADVQAVRNSNTRNDASKVAAGAVIGAIAGQVLGKDTRSTVIGAAAGAAAGTAAAAATANFEGCLPQGGRIAIRLSERVQVRAE